MPKVMIVTFVIRTHDKCHIISKPSEADARCAPRTQGDGSVVYTGVHRGTVLLCTQGDGSVVHRGTVLLCETQGEHRRTVPLCSGGRFCCTQGDGSVVRNSG